MQKSEELKGQSILVYDLETDSLDINSCNIISFHAYSYKHDKYYDYLFEGNENLLQQLLDSHLVYVSFNGDEFDTKIVSRYYKKKYNYTKPIDLLKVIKRRHTLLKYGGFLNKSLKNVAKELNLINQKIEGFPYTKLRDSKWVIENEQLIMTYGHQDINVTKELFEYLYDFFYFFQEFLGPHENNTWSWLMSSPGTYAYKVICYMAGLDETWLSNEEKEKLVKKEFEGGYVSSPLLELVKDNIYCFDFNSAYPHAFIMMNLFGNNCSCCKEHEKYTGDNFFKLSGRYCAKQLNKISKVIKNMYGTRQELKRKKDKREFVLKLILNTIYGICASPVFKNVYNLNRVKDCTEFSRTCIKLARDKFKKAGYTFLYTDTDSVYIVDVFNDKEKMLKIKDDIINTIKYHVPFPVDSFDMGIDDEIKLMYFPGQKKKKYLYVTKDNKIKVKGLSIIRRDSSKLTSVLYDKYIKPEILKGNVQLDFDYLKDLAEKEIKADISIATKNFNVKNSKKYISKTSINYLLSQEFEEGNYNLIPNTIIGIGKSKKYCTIKEFKKEKLLITDIDLTNVWSELSPFIKGYKKNKLVTRYSKNQTLMEAWCEI